MNTAHHSNNARSTPSYLFSLTHTLQLPNPMRSLLDPRDAPLAALPEADALLVHRHALLRRAAAQRLGYGAVARVQVGRVGEGLLGEFLLQRGGVRGGGGVGGLAVAAGGGARGHAAGLLDVMSVGCPMTRVAIYQK